MPFEILERLVHPAERAVELSHENSSDQGDHHVGIAAPSPEDAPPTSVHAGRVVRRAENPLLVPHQGQPLPLVPSVVSSGKDVDPGLEEFPDDRARHPDAACSVLPICDDQVDVPAGSDPGQKFPYRPSAGLSDHVS